MSVQTQARQVAGQRFAVHAEGNGAAARSSPYISNTYAEELRETAKFISNRGRGILASDESNVTTGKRLASVGMSCHSLQSQPSHKAGLLHMCITKNLTSHTRGVTGCVKEQMGINQVDPCPLQQLGTPFLQVWTTQRTTGVTGGSCCTQHQTWASTLVGPSCLRRLCTSPAQMAGPL